MLQTNPTAEPPEFDQVRRNPDEVHPYPSSKQLAQSHSALDVPGPYSNEKQVIKAPVDVAARWFPDNVRMLLAGQPRGPLGIHCASS